MTNQVCTVCDQGSLHAEVSNVEQMIRGNSVAVQHHIHWCDACGLEITTSDDARANARAMRAAERSQSGKLVGAEIAQIRKNLGFTQEHAGLIFGGGPVAFCKYEKNDLAPSDAMDNLLWLIKSHPALASELAARAGLPPRLRPGMERGAVRFVAGGLEVGRRMVETMSHAIDESKLAWMPGVWAIKDRQASNQSSITLTEAALSGQAA